MQVGDIYLNKIIKLKVKILLVTSSQIKLKEMEDNEEFFLELDDFILNYDKTK
ncbi:hypothetical protein [Pseudoalteromonas denitrificans]|uniref:Uncharacterized protein n=1 Tax=Pseudoalteromonas denitrificans DSM 6059 TaxID=1123010 RepID=A0A1I1P4W3_9GAMM|nr:hypothetical protein [Pseudoalteromonas denitrificans]SFD04612.1 hypothetical protein SAMN02745724_03298 [Pseudoalteromonas denitrificans DSM 6059]